MTPYAPWLLLLLPLLGRAFARNGRLAAPWSARVDLPAALGVGTLGAALATAWTSPPTFVGWTLTASDFSHYCQCTWALATHDPSRWIAQRAKLPGLVAGWAAGPLGVVDGLAVGALVGQALLFTALYLWARALHGRLAGVAAVLVGCALTPVAQLGRTLTFYPMSTALFVVCMATTALAARVRHPLTTLAVGLGAGVAMLTDVRGVTYALAALGIGAVLALREGRGAPLRLGLLITPMIASWFAGRWAFPADTPTLQMQVALWLDDACAHAGQPLRGAFTGPGFVWGHGRPTDALRALRWIADAQAAMPAAVATAAVTVQDRDALLGPWAAFFAPCTLVAIWGMRRRPWVLAAGVGSVVPFVASALVVLRWLPMSRYLAGGMAAFAVVAGVAFATIAEGALQPEDRRLRRDPTILGALLAGGLLFGAVTGALPSYLSPTAPWRETHREGGTDPYAPLRRAATHTEWDNDMRCPEALRADHARGLPFGSRLHGLDAMVDVPTDDRAPAAP